MHLGDLLYEISKRGITLTCGHTEDRLNAKPTAALTAELIEEIKKHKNELIQIVREDEEMRRTGIVQNERQVFELAREFFGLNQGEVPRETRASRAHLGWVGTLLKVFFSNPQRLSQFTGSAGRCHQVQFFKV